MNYKNVPGAKIRVASPVIGEREKGYVNDCLESGWISSIGIYLARFEESFARFCGVKHAIATNNGTTALHLALVALGVGPGDEVIVPTLSYIATANAVRYCGATPVLIDCDEETLNIDVLAIESKMTPRTRAIIPVHLYGQPADMEAIIAIARKHKLWVIEDCAQAHLARCNGQVVGTFGDIATFSFYPGKNLGAYGDAGCAVTNDDHLADWMATFARHGGKGEHTMEGINSRMDGLQATILNVKLPYLLAWTGARRRVAARYDELLNGVGGIVTPKVALDRDHVYHLYVIRTEKRDALRKDLTNAGIATVLNYPKALPFYPAYAYLSHAPQDFPVAYANQSRILSLPIYPEMTEEMIAYIVDRIESFFQKSENIAVAQLAERHG